MHLNQVTVTRKEKLILTRYNNADKIKIFSAVFLTLFLVISVFFNSCAGTTKSVKDKPVIIFGRVDIKGDTVGINPRKFDAALALSIKLSKKFDYISLDKSQELLGGDSSRQIKITEIADEAGADYIATAQVNTLKNIIRTQIVLSNVNEPEKRFTGAGYSAVNYIDAGSGEKVYDPSLLSSLQRALAVALNDSNMFVNPEMGINVRPLPTLVIGSIAFLGESKNEWDLYTDKVVASYAAVETIFEAAKKSTDYVFYDTDTRDSVYKIFGFNIVENYSPPSIHEIRALYQMAVDYYVAGSITRTAEGADLTVSLYSIEKDGLILLKSENEKFTDDSRMVFLEHVGRAARRLFGLAKNP